MHILLTGSSGSVGSATLLYLLQQGHQVTSIDIVPLPRDILIATNENLLQHYILDLTDFHELEDIFSRNKEKKTPFDGVIHLSAIPKPGNHDPRVVHNNNVVSSYNVLYTAVKFGVKRIVQASSVNALGLTYTPEGKQRFDELPLTEEAAYRPQDEYALSKQICEIQAESLCRTYPDFRIASLRFHMVTPTYEKAQQLCQYQDLWSWVSHEASARACILGITSEGWTGAEVFALAAPEICWEGGVEPSTRRAKDAPSDKSVGTLELLEYSWKGRYASVRKDWWAGNPRRALWDCTKAERLLGWKHDP